MVFWKKLLLLSFGLLMLLSFSGCRLFFEPESDAVERLLASCPTGDARFVREMCVEDSCKQLSSLCKLIGSSWYNARTGFFEVREIERHEDTGRSLVFVSINQGPSVDDGKSTLVFEMERTKLRWYIYSVDGIDEFLRRAEGRRGIL